MKTTFDYVRFLFFFWNSILTISVMFEVWHRFSYIKRARIYTYVFLLHPWWERGGFRGYKNLPARCGKCGGWRHFRSFFEKLNSDKYIYITGRGCVRGKRKSSLDFHSFTFSSLPCRIISGIIVLPVQTFCSR